MNRNFQALPAAIAFALMVATVPTLAGSGVPNVGNHAQVRSVVIALDDASPGRATGGSSTDGSGGVPTSLNNQSPSTVGAADSSSAVDDLEIATGLDLKGPSRHFNAHNEPDWDWLSVR